MRVGCGLGCAVVLLTGLSGQARQPASSASQNLRVILLGTQAGPTFHAQRIGIGTLVVAGPERLLFDADAASRPA